MLLIYFAFNFELYVFSPFSSPSLALTNLSMNDITCLTRCQLFYFQTATTSLYNASFSNIEF